MDKEDAIKTLKVYLNDAYTNEDLRLAIEALHPELRVSEEERTIDSLMSFLNGLSENEIPDQKMFLKWWVFLKKQKERTLEDVAKEVTKDKETAITFLKNAGIMDENGELTEMYRPEGSENVTWNDEDEMHLNRIQIVLENIPDDIRWLKARLHQPNRKHWKPTEEQLDVLADVINSYDYEDDEYKVLAPLLDSLEKLV